jgi:hypothetical protein
MHTLEALLKQQRAHDSKAAEQVGIRRTPFVFET